MSIGRNNSRVVRGHSLFDHALDERRSEFDNKGRSSFDRPDGEGGSEMRILITSLVVLAVLYFWDKGYNNGKLLDGLESMRQSIAHNMFH